jgi:hypothetical protein
MQPKSSVGYFVGFASVVNPSMCFLPADNLQGGVQVRISWPAVLHGGIVGGCSANCGSRGRPSGNDRPHWQKGVALIRLADSGGYFF